MTCENHEQVLHENPTDYKARVKKTDSGARLIATRQGGEYLTFDFASDDEVRRTVLALLDYLNGRNQ